MTIRRIAAALACAVALAGCADYVGDDLRRGAASVPPAIEEEIIAGATTTSTTPLDPVPPRQLEVGTCADDVADEAGNVPSDIGPLLAGAPVRPKGCADEHRYEVFARLDLGSPEAAWPGPAALAEDGDRACTERFEAFVGREWAGSTLDHAALLPDEAAWAAGERRGVCVLFDLGLVPLEGTMEGSGR